MMIHTAGRNGSYELNKGRDKKLRKLN